MRWTPLFCLAAAISAGFTQESKPLETPYTPFDFDNYRRSPQAVRKSSQPWASKTNPDLQRKLLSEEEQQTDNLASQAAALFPDPKTIPLRKEPEPPPTPQELIDELTIAKHGKTTKGQKDLLARGRLSTELDLSSMTEEDYEVYIAQQQAGQANPPAKTGEALLRPMPTLVNTKTGGPPHAYSVSQAGLGARAEPRDGQDQFEEITRFFRLGQPLTRGTDSWPSPSTSASTVSVRTELPQIQTPQVSPGATDDVTPESAEAKP